MKKVFLSVVIPAYNEAENFKKGCLEQVARYLTKQEYSWEVILVDDGSTDETPRFLKEFVKKNKGFQYKRIVHGGKLAAVWAGVRMADGQYLLYTDFDQAVPLGETEKMLREFEKGAEVVVGSRFGKGSKRRGDSLISKTRSEIFRRLAQVLVGREIEDTQCGFKGFESLVGRELFGAFKVHGVHRGGRPFMGAFDVELLLMAKKRGLKIALVPVEWRRIESPRLTWVEPWLMLASLFKIGVYNLLGRYEEEK